MRFVGLLEKRRTPRLPTSRRGNSVGDIIFLSSNLPPEHHRACSTDDVECFFSVLHDSLGTDFTLK